MNNFSKRLAALINKINGLPERFDKHILHTYFMLRWTMVVLGFALPPFLVIDGLNSWWWLSMPLPVQNSLSAYYHAGFAGLECTALAGAGVYRDLFVGFLSAISICLIVYSGYSCLENWLLNFAGVFLFGVAFFPTGWLHPQLPETCENIQPFEASKLFNLPIPIHTASAVLFFLFITAVTFLTAMNTVKKIEDDRKKELWKNVFTVARWLMPIAIGLVLLIKLFFGNLIGERLVLWIEWAGIWAFSLYWMLKSIEILTTNVEEKLFKK